MRNKTTTESTTKFNVVTVFGYHIWFKSNCRYFALNFNAIQKVRD